MTYLKISLSRVQPAILKSIAGSLKSGRVVVLPTDTIYGLSCLATDSRAIKKIFRLKKRAAKNPLAVLVGDFKMLKKYVFVSPTQEKFLRLTWRQNKRPTTFILCHRGNLPPEMTAGSSGLAVRLPKSKFLTKIIKSAGVPLVSTSLNQAGQTPLNDLQDLSLHFPLKSQQPDLVIDAGRSRCLRPSRLIDLRGEGQPLILRK